MSPVSVHELEFRAMGCQMLAALDQSSPRAASRLAEVPQWFEAWEQCLSRFRQDSELNRLNRSAGIEFQVSPTLWSVFQTALQAERESQGLVTPAVLDAVLAAGYDRSFDSQDFAVMPPVSHPLDFPALGTGQAGQINTDPQAHTVCLPEDIHLDFGGVGKGWAAHQAVQKLKLYGPALVDAGGDIAISGLQSDGKPWPVGVADPLHPSEDLALLGLGRCGVATSGRDYRRWQKNGAWKHHIIDPRSGLPAETDVLSATVIAPTVIEAEMAAKTALISGSQAGLAWLDNRPGLAGLLILEDGTQLPSRRFHEYLWR